ncbi:hypothetical protein [Streptomyces palmae]|uniref:DUF732 domain-containing protein n=1 Tax=Streptomyces palmae TaxID=1701085 RepID=A0A4Z0GEI0_9ACTN|nr:hypothetical protein [Streptomyces palmae]TGA94411.1 hypothetical protein E4099_26310 [Streptomyces palmae]
MRRNTVVGIVAAGVLAGGGALFLFQDDDAKDTSGDAKPKHSAGAPRTEQKDAPADAPQAESAVPSPDPAQTADLLRRLRAIHPALAADEAKAVSRARNVCDDAQWTEGDDTAVGARAAQRFSGGDVPTLGPEQGVRIVTAVRESFCS